MNRVRLAGDLPGIDLDGALGFLDRHGMLFREHDRMLSLVLPRPPKPPEALARARNPAAVA